MFKPWHDIVSTESQHRRVLYTLLAAGHRAAARDDGGFNGMPQVRVAPGLALLSSLSQSRALTAAAHTHSPQADVISDTSPLHGVTAEEIEELARPLKSCRTPTIILVVGKCPKYKVVC